MQHVYFMLTVLAIGLLACNNIDTARPPCEAQEAVVTIPQDTSFVSTPLVIPTQLIEDKINRAIKQDLLTDDDFNNRRKKDGKKDKLKLKVTRLGDIKIRWKDNVASYDAPLRVLAEKQIVGRNIVPLSKSLSIKTEFSLRLVFATTVDVGPDWRIVPKTKFVSFQWLSEVKALNGLIDVKKMVERRLSQQMPEILENLDSTIHLKVSLEKAVTKVWQKIQKPIVINRREQLVWLKFKPIRFEMGTITTDSSNLLIEGRLLATTETLIGDNPPYTIDSVLPRLVKRRQLSNDAYVYMLSEIPYKDINTIVNEKLAAKVFKISGHRLKVVGAEIWGCGPNLVLHLQVRGGVKGDIYFQGTPQYDPVTQQLVIQNFDFEVKTGEMLLASADWLMHGTFKEQMQDALSINLGDKVSKIPQVIMKGIEQGKAGEKMDFTIQQWEFKPQQIWVRPNELVALVIVNAQVRIELEKI